MRSGRRYEFDGPCVCYDGDDDCLGSAPSPPSSAAGCNPAASCWLGFRFAAISESSAPSERSSCCWRAANGSYSVVAGCLPLPLQRSLVSRIRKPPRGGPGKALSGAVRHPYGCRHQRVGCRALPLQGRRDNPRRNVRPGTSHDHNAGRHACSTTRSRQPSGQVDRRSLGPSRYGS